MKIERIYQIQIEGLVQGVGFRPFVYTLASELNLKGFIQNNNKGVLILVKTDEENFNYFLSQIQFKKPLHSKIDKVTVKTFDKLNFEFTNFKIKTSDDSDPFIQEIFKVDSAQQNRNKTQVWILPDLALCTECKKEILDSNNRRYQYFFTNCTQCGPRFSILNESPYDREHTTMKNFKMCQECLAEYENPMDRRFHAQPNACTQCGPQVFYQKTSNSILSQGFQALESCVDHLKKGYIIAIKGLGGYHLVADATQDSAIQELRKRKRRATKPFALMVKSTEEIQAFCQITSKEEQLLTSPAAPIVLLKKKLSFRRQQCLNPNSKIQPQDRFISDFIAPNNPYLGVMLPYTPLHCWLMELFSGPLVMTSANITDEPLVYKEPEVFLRLNGLADFYLTHNRPIARPIDDSIVQIINEKVFVLRSARGLAPSILVVDNALESAMGVGAHMKSNFSISIENKIITSQHIGDLESELSQKFYHDEFLNYKNYFRHQVHKVIHDAHPGYFTTEWSNQTRNSFELQKKIQHHRAHVYATLAENTDLLKEENKKLFLGAIWDGTGYGDDGTLWGGEFFVFNSKNELQRIASIKPFQLLGGESSIRFPWKVALSLLFEIDLNLGQKWFEKNFPEKEEKILILLQQQWQLKLNSISTSSVGRLFDGVSALLGLCFENTFEAEAAIALEFVCSIYKEDQSEGSSNFSIQSQSIKPQSLNRIDSTDGNWMDTYWSFKNDLWEWDWRPFILEIVSTRCSFTKENWAYRFHQLLTQSLFDMLKILGHNQLVLGGGVFQNRILLEMIMIKAKDEEVQLILPKHVPLNDGGISVGQIISQLNFSRDV